jgi:hypothetical protein
MDIQNRFASIVPLLSTFSQSTSSDGHPNQFESIVAQKSLKSTSSDRHSKSFNQNQFKIIPVGYSIVPLLENFSKRIFSIVLEQFKME